MKHRAVFFAKVIGAGACVAASGCAATTSVRTTDNAGMPVQDGLVYRMPKRDIRVTITPGQGQTATSIAVEASEAYPDTGTHFVLEHRRNFIGTNATNVGINDNGLLTSSNSTITNSTDALATAIGSAAGTNRALAAPLAPREDCRPGQAYRVLIEPGSVAARNGVDHCGYTITVVPRGEASFGASQRLDDSYQDRRQSGVFYRQSLPYTVTVAAGGNMNEFIVFSPSEAPTSFLPISRSVFANSSAKLSFKDGMPTVYDQSTDGEAVAFLSLPAKIVGAYFKAIADSFTALKSNAANEQAYLDAVNKLAIAELARTTCRDAILAGKPDDQIRAACGGQ